MFRTLKQSIGLAFCSARAIEKQHRHVSAAFLGFAFVQHPKFLKQFDCSEDAIRALQITKMGNITNSFVRFCREFGDE